MTVALETDREVDVGFGDAADTAVHERQPHFVVLLVELAQRVGERFEGTLHVGLDDEVERGDLAALHRREDVFEASAAAEHHRVALRRRLAAMRARFGDRARHLVVRRDAQLVAGERHVVETEDLDRHRRTGFADLLAVLVEHRAHATPGGTGDDRVADAQRAFFDQRRDDRTTALSRGATRAPRARPASSGSRRGLRRSRRRRRSMSESSSSSTPDPSARRRRRRSCCRPTPRERARSR